MRHYLQHTLQLQNKNSPFNATLIQPPQQVQALLLVANSLAEERKGILPPVIQLARDLATRKIATLICDYPGCGDSPGTFSEINPTSLSTSLDAALEWLSKNYPSLPLALLGVRIGSSLVLELAATHPEVSATMLWAPLNGTNFMRQLLQRRMINDMVAYGKARENRQNLEERWGNGEAVDLDGYLFSAPMYNWLTTRSLTNITQPLYLALPSRESQETLTPALLSNIRTPPFWNTVGHVDLTPLINESATWLHTQLTSTSNPTTSHPALTSPAPLAPPSLDLPDTNPTVRAYLEHPNSTPIGGILMLHGWSGDRTGPHNLFVEAARLLNSIGWQTIRPDFTGRGLSDGTSSQAAIATMADNAQAALNFLQHSLPPDAPLVVIGICSGCKVAITLAARNPHISQLVLWSAESMGSLRSHSTGTRKTLDALKTYARKLTRPETWKKILRGKVQTNMVAKALVKHETRSAEEARWEDQVLHQFSHYSNPTLFIFGGSDPDAPGSLKAYSSYCRKHKIPFTTHTIPHAGHSYYSTEWTTQLLAHTTHFLETTT